MSSPLLLVPTPDRSCFTFLSSIFLKKGLFKIAIRKVSLWHFHDVLLYPGLVHALHFSPFYLNSLLIVISTGFKNANFKIRFLRSHSNSHRADFRIIFIFLWSPNSVTAPRCQLELLSLEPLK
jgi:hypothetical protein